jgi:hypothetical protein
LWHQFLLGEEARLLGCAAITRGAVALNGRFPMSAESKKSASHASEWTVQWKLHQASSCSTSLWCFAMAAVQQGLSGWQGTCLVMFRPLHHWVGCLSVSTDGCVR